MRLILLAMVVALAWLPLSGRAAPASAPASVALAGQAISITPPAGWQAKDFTAGAKSITYANADATGSITLTVEPQPAGAPTTADLRTKIGPQMAEAIAARLAHAKAQIVVAPRIEDDGRFALRIHDAFKAGDQSVDQIHLYHVVGDNLVLATSSALSATPQQAAAVHKAAEQLLAGARAGAAVPAINGRGPATATAPSDTPIALARAKVRLFPPAGWTADTTDRIDGTIATLRDPTRRSCLMRVDCYVIPDEMKTDPAGRKKYIEGLVNGTQQTFKLDGAEMSGKPQKVADPRFLKKVRIIYEGGGAKYEVSSRHIAVGDAVLTITTLGTAEEADTLLETADRFALAVKPLGK